MADDLDTSGAVRDYLTGTQQTNARLSVAGAIGTSGDLEAELRAASQRTGVPISSARTLPEETKRRAAMADFDDFAQRFPSTTAFLAEQDNARIAHDDLDSMGNIERSLRRGWAGLKQLGPTLTIANTAGALGNIDEIDRRLAAGEKPEAIASSSMGPLANMYAYMTPEEKKAFRTQYAPKLPEVASGAVQRVGELEAERRQFPAPDSVSRFTGASTFTQAMSEFAKAPLEILTSIGPESLVQSLPGLVAAVPAAIATGGTGAAATVGLNSFLVDYAATAREVLQGEGVDLTDGTAVQQALRNPAIVQKMLSQASAHAGVVGAVDAASAGIASRTILPKALLSSRPVARQAANLAVQTPVQGALGAAGEAGGQVAAGQPLQPGQILAEAFGELAGAPVEVFTSSAGRIADTLQRRAAARANAQEVAQDTAAIQQLMTAAGQSKLRERDPTAFADFVQKTATASDAPTEVFVEARVLAEALNQSAISREQINAALPSVATQLDEALATGGDVVIPVGEFAAGLAGSPVEQAVMPHVRTAPEALSQAEGQQVAEADLAPDAERLAGQQEADDGARGVRQTILDQLNTAGRFSPAVNAAYADNVAALYETQAERLGTTPAELYERFPLNVRAGEFRQTEAFGQDESGASQSEAPAAEPAAPAGWGSVGASDSPANAAPGAMTKGVFKPATNTIALAAGADLTTFTHEQAHFYLEFLSTIAATPDAPQSIKDDMQTVLDWFGWKGTVAEWAAQPIDQRRDNHESFARGFEAYLFEGKAPSPALAGIFQRFSEWARRVYRSIKALNVEISDDVRRVYDRMLASEDAIREMENLRSFAPLFLTAEQQQKAGIDAAAYQALGAEATAEAVQDLQARSMRDIRWLSNAKGRALKALQKEAAEQRKTIRDEVAAEVGQLQVYATEDFLKTGRLEVTDPTNAQRRAIEATAGTSAKLDLPALKAMYGDGPAAPWRYLSTGKRGLATTKDGVHPEVVAEIFGFDSADAMVRALLERRPRAELIDEITDRRMLERYGELSSPQALERAAEQAVHNEARGRFIATELSALDKALGSVRVLTAAAKQFADQVIGAKVISEIKPKAFIAAETRAGKRAMQALKSDLPAAVEAKRDQLLNYHAARAAMDAEVEIRKIREFFRRVATTPDDRLKATRDLDMVNAARAVLAEYGVGGRRTQAASEYLRKVDAYDPATAQVLRDAVDAAVADAKPLDELTLNELRALRDEVDGLWHLAKRSRQMEVDGKLVERETIEGALLGRMQEIGIPEEAPGTTSAITPGQQRLNLLRSFRAAARRVESWVGAMDGEAPIGAFRRYVWQTIKEPADAYRSEKARYLKQFRDALVPIADTLRKQTIAAPELGYTFGKDTGGVALTEILHAIAHTGNASNKRKLLLGRKWAEELENGTLDTRRWDAFVARLAREGVLQKAHFDFVQATWDLLETTKPLAQATHRDVFGKYFDEITAEPVQTPFGEYRGGYVPALADSRIVADAKTRALMESENNSLAYAFPATNRGFTKGRVEYNRPLMLDLRTIPQHIDRVLLFSHMERPLRDVRRVLTSGPVASALNRIDPEVYDNLLTPWLNRATKQQVEAPVSGSQGLLRFASALRSRTGMAAMFGNVVNTLQQVSGFSIAALKVKPRYLLSATASYIAAPRQTADAVAAGSQDMEGRMRNEAQQMNDAIRDVLIDPTVLQSSQAWLARHAYFMQSAVDNIMGPIIWIAARNQALEQGQSDRDAARLADSAVRETQGSTLPEDVSRIETGNAFVRLFSQFAGYFNMQANLLGTEFVKLVRDAGLRNGAGRGLYILLFGFLVPAWISEAIVQGFRGGPGDEDDDGEYLDDWLAAVFGMSTIRGATAMVPVVGPAINTAINMRNTKPYDDRLTTAPALSMLESALRGGSVGVLKLFSDEELRARDVRDMATLISLTVGLPVNVAAKPIGYLVEMANGRVQPTSELDAARGLVTGTASPDSR